MAPVVTREAQLHMHDMRRHDQHLFHTPITYLHTNALVVEELCLLWSSNLDNELHG